MSSELEPCLLKQPLKTQRKLKELETISVSEIKSISVFLDIKKLLISGGEMLMSAELKGLIMWFIYALDLL